MQTVVFGPWIGELGWELTSWQGWVRKVCETKHKNDKKIVVAFAGREVLYGNILNSAEFISIPDWFCQIDYSARAYATDYWWHDAPNVREKEFNKIRNVSAYCKKLLKEIKRLIGDATYYVPWKCFTYNGVVIGGITNTKLNSHPRFNPKIIPFAHQELRPLSFEHTLLEEEMKKQDIDSNKPIVSMFPRNRQRGSSRNWPIEYYKSLSKFIINHNMTPCYIGTPNQSYFSEFCESGILNLVNLHDIKNRLNIHVAAMNRSVVGLGPASGIIHVAMWSGLPCISSGMKSKDKTFFSKKANPFMTDISFFNGLPTYKEILESLRKRIEL